MTSEKKNGLVKFAATVIVVIMFAAIIASTRMPAKEAVLVISAVMFVALAGALVAVISIVRIVGLARKEIYEKNKNGIRNLDHYLDANVKTARDIFLHAEEIKRLMLVGNMIKVNTTLNGQKIIYWLATADLPQPKLQVLAVEGVLKAPKIICEA